MTLYEFIAGNPGITFLLAVIAGITLIGVAEAIASVFRTKP